MKTLVIIVCALCLFSCKDIDADSGDMTNDENMSLEINVESESMLNSDSTEDALKRKMKELGKLVIQVGSELNKSMEDVGDTIQQSMPDNAGGIDQTSGD